MNPEESVAIITALAIACVVLAYANMLLIVDRFRVTKPAPAAKPPEDIRPRNWRTTWNRGKKTQTIGKRHDGRSDKAHMGYLDRPRRRELMGAGSTPNWAVFAAVWLDFFVFVVGWLLLWD